MNPTASTQDSERDWSVFLSSVFFVLGFSVVFSLVGVLLQTVLSGASYTVQEWLGRIGGVVIILFGFFLLGFFTPAFLKRDHTILVKHRFRSRYLTSFVFGAAFAVGWTPCITAGLGAILTLATTSASSAFLLLVAYTIGLGVPFLLVGLFTSRAQALINRAGKKLLYFQYFFGIILIALGVLVFTGTLARVANLQFLTDTLLRLNLVTSVGGEISSLSILNFGVSFLAGVGSFLSPCILPLIPGFLSYLASTAVKEEVFS